MKTVEEIKKRIEEISKEMVELDNREDLRCGEYTELTDRLEAEKETLEWVLD